MIDDRADSNDVAFVDANIIIRYFLQDQPAVTEAVRQIIEEHPRMLLTEGTIAEVGYVLTRRYGIVRHIVVDTIISLLERRNISVYHLDTGIVIQALLLCRPSGRVSFADAMLWASVRHSGTSATIYTLDRRFPSVGITVRDDLPE